MAEKPNHEFMNPLRRADEARITRTIKPIPRVADQQAGRLERLEQRDARADAAHAVRTAARETTRTAAPAQRAAPRSPGNRTMRRGTPGWLVLIAVVIMAAGFAGALYYLGSGWEEESAAPVTTPAMKTAPK